jgi:hypothetical protein
VVERDVEAIFAFRAERVPGLVAELADGRPAAGTEAQAAGAASASNTRFAPGSSPSDGAR